MNYVEVTINNIDEDQQEILVAQLSDAGYEGFVQSADSLQAYIDEPTYDATELKEITGDSFFETKIIPKQNWNEVWESNFEPVIVEDFCTIRADFHDIEVTTPYEIIITPKMSFGTGHHATTQLVMMAMKHMDIAGKTVFDFGTGTGVLAIMAEKLGAASVFGIDNDEWSVENALENLGRNNSTRITVEQNNTDLLPQAQYDIILANINRHILLQYMPQLATCTVKDGIVLMSGLLTSDKDIITATAGAQGLELFDYQELNNWIVLSFRRK
ncbi:50S ribosomal protein L11 methyltransferase [Flavipsychrobacter stenotrophus]|uniref:Ribosomal protein L11 methyltransferase n=1 Tax=Flavipsychrobacter stenotrophus TaxID=2077091 RepID=A0A2S7SXF7_9BACT|nr:50S ribosomal protein L11 methyltransferase [Flavipsychrobacter stenotrophus]PQJ11398.1 50S ribosomal protein L11 methyltransferase [Flavipsychrobacter stenotrophus]